VAVVLRVALYNAIIGGRVTDDELSTSFLENSLATAYGLTAPDTNELGLAARVFQEHLASEQNVELVQTDIALNECSLTIKMMAFTSL